MSEITHLNTIPDANSTQIENKHPDARSVSIETQKKNLQ